MQIRRIVIDVLKPHEPSILVYSEKVVSLKCVDSVTISVAEIDDKTETVEVVVEGGSLNFKLIEKVIEKLGGSVHSVDLVSAGSRVVEPEDHEMR